MGRGDVTTQSVGVEGKTLRAAVAARQELVVYGIELAEEIFGRVDSNLNIKKMVKDGALLKKGGQALVVEGDASTILMAERTVLNFMQRLSGVATLAKKFADKIAHTEAKIVDTRKTTPGYRALEKAAVLAGGAFNHRFDLGSGVLIKDNHIAALGSVKQAVQNAKKSAPHGLKIEVEVDTEEQLNEALSAGADIVLLDNFSPGEVKRLSAVAHAKGVLVECSGGITLDTVKGYAEAGVDIISSGAITHSALSVDLGLDSL